MERVVETNVNGLFYATRAVLGPMREQGFGHLINISSISGKFPLAGGTPMRRPSTPAPASRSPCFRRCATTAPRHHDFPGSVDSASHRHDPGADHGWKVTPEEVDRPAWTS